MDIGTHTLPMTCTVLIRHLYQVHTGKAVTDQELASILDAVDEGDRVSGVADEDMLLEVLEQDEVKALQACSGWQYVADCRCVWICLFKVDITHFELEL